MGRPKGSGNKRDPAKIFVTAVEHALAKAGERGITDSFVNLTCREIKKGNTNLMLRLLDMRYGKPKETKQITGVDGGPLKMIVEHIQAD